MSVQHRGMVELVLDGTPIPGPFSHKSGGQSSSEATRRYPGHMLPSVTYAGPATRENLVLRRADDLPQALMDWLEGRIGSATGTATFIRLDKSKRPWRRRAYTVTLLRVEEAEYNSDSNEDAELEFEFAVDGP